MKINLNGIFKDIKRLVDAPTKPDVRAPTEHSFDKILASISPRKEEILRNINKLNPDNKVNNEIKFNSSDIRAGINFNLPETILPDPVPIQILTDETIKDSLLSESVKTPTVLDARRITRDAYTVLKKPERISAANQLARKFGLEEGIDPALSMSIIANESSFDTTAVSRDGHYSKGLMQLLDSTGSQYHRQVGIREDYDPFDPEQNVKLGISYLRYLHDIFSKETALPNKTSTVAAANSSSLEKLAVAAFNAGEGRVASAQARAQQAGLNPSDYTDVEGYLPETTRKYVERVMQNKIDFGQIQYG